MMESDPPQVLQRDRRRGKQKPRSLIQEAQLIDDVSVGHMSWDETPAEMRPERESNYLLISKNGAITRFHQDFSSTSVFYYLAKGLYQFLVQSIKIVL